MINIANAQAFGDFAAWLRLLNGMFAMVRPFISGDMAGKLRGKLDDIGKQYGKHMPGTMPSNTVGVVNRHFDRLLQEATEDIYQTLKYMLLPIKAEDETEWTSELFHREHGK